MRPYTDAPYASMEVKLDDQLIDTLSKLFKDHPPEAIIETGTYLGLGSTSIFAQAIENSEIPYPNFITIEANKSFWLQAKRNLKKFPYINPLFGRTIKLDDAREFINTDPALNNQNDYPNVFIDPGVDYYAETKGDEKGDDPDWQGEGLLGNYLDLFKDCNNIFICLDSAGGIGWLEFWEVVKTMGSNKHYYLFLDDQAGHIKHWRSALYIAQHPEHFTTVLCKHGWGLYKHSSQKTLHG